MGDFRATLARYLFVALVAVGLGLLVIGAVVEPNLPRFALDRELTAGEWADPGKRSATITLLERAEGNRPLAGMVIHDARERRPLGNGPSRSAQSRRLIRSPRCARPNSGRCGLVRRRVAR